jgi:intraflagellar transport protein 122
LFAELYNTAELYYAYDIIFRAVNNPFATESPRVVQNAACYLHTQLVDRTAPDGILLSHVAYILAQAASGQHNWKLARTAHLKLQSLKVQFSTFTWCHCRQCATQAQVL